MSVTINGNGTISGYTPTTISGQLATTNMPAGSVIQVQSGIETSQVQYVADQFTAGPEVTITASNASNKILIMGTISIGEGTGGDVHVFLYKDGSALSGAIGQAVGNNTRSTSGLSCGRSAWDTQTTPVFYMETAGDTSSHTYKITAMATNTSIALNRQQNGNQNMDNDNSHISHITAMEVKG